MHSLEVEDASRLQLAPRHLQVLRELLQAHVPQAQVWAYGSRVTGGAHEGSDLDLVLRNTTRLSVPCEGWLDLKEALQESRLPILVDVHDWARLPADFHRNIERGYVELQAGASSCANPSATPSPLAQGQLQKEATQDTRGAFEHSLHGVPDSPAAEGDAAMRILRKGKGKT